MTRGEAEEGTGTPGASFRFDAVMRFIANIFYYIFMYQMITMVVKHFTGAGGPSASPGDASPAPTGPAAGVFPLLPPDTHVDIRVYLAPRSSTTDPHTKLQVRRGCIRYGS